ncbi:glycosyltransferase [Candidatus Pelagibacter giovannonii]|uniref:Glycosyltransferase n=1 Tax=Candidatus Pelagibacter giovannonii TaxID=2563896 RepID=A0A6H1Q1V9_9PROT|nr:glycosyltransferase [Candidatus Pelagibacter giovannonii]QIZ20808.1 glycosyltransferase [Candidatus Pelagibacter giovannonii]
MNLLFSSDSLLNEAGGQSQAIFDLSDELKKKKISHGIYTSKNNGLNQMNYNLFNEIKNKDLIHNFGIWSMFHIYNYYLAKRNKKPLIISPLGMMEPWPLSQKKIKKYLAYSIYQKKILDNCDFIHATSKMEADNLLKLGIKSKIEFIPHGTNLNYTVPDEKYKFSLSKGRKILLFLSRFDNKKGILELIKQFNKINNKDWMLLISSYENDNYLKAKKEFKDNKNIYFFGKSNLENKKKLYSISDFFVLPSYSENFGLAIMESLSYSCPVLTSSATPWTHLHNSSGLVFNDVKKDLNNSLKNVFALSDHDIIKFKNNCHNDLKDYKWEKISNDYIELYKKTLNKY